VIFNYESIKAQEKGKTEVVAEFLHALAAFKDFRSSTNYSIYDYINSGNLMTFGASASSANSDSIQLNLARAEHDSLMQIETNLQR